LGGKKRWEVSASGGRHKPRVRINRSLGWRPLGQREHRGGSGRERLKKIVLVNRVRKGRRTEPGGTWEVRKKKKKPKYRGNHHNMHEPTKKNGVILERTSVK